MGEHGDRQEAERAVQVKINMVAAEQGNERLPW
jgi:hypothetical protein